MENNNYLSTASNHNHSHRTRNRETVVPKHTTATPASSLTVRPQSQRIVQNFLLVWLDGNFNENHPDFQHSLTQLRKIVLTLQLYTDANACIEYMRNIGDEKIFLMISGALGQKIVPQIHNMTQLDTIIVFCANIHKHKQWAQEWSKIEGVHQSIHSICQVLSISARACDRNIIRMSFVPQQATSVTTYNKQNIDQLPSSYVYSVLFKEIILNITERERKCIKNLVKYCRDQGIDESELNNFKTTYNQKSPIWWYTAETFLYSLLNKALRSVDMEAIMKLGFFIRNLHQQLQHLFAEQSGSFQQIFQVYRGQGLSQEDFQQLRDMKGGILSFNNFLSTSKNPQVAMNFAENAIRKNSQIVGVVFIITIELSKILASITPFAMIDNYSASPGDEEILFTMHTVFRIVDLKQTTDNHRLWEVKLTITDDNNPELIALTRHMKEKINGYGWDRMGKLMIEIGHFNQAEILYKELLQHASNDNDRAYISNQLEHLKNKQQRHP